MKALKTVTKAIFALLGGFVLVSCSSTQGLIIKPQNSGESRSEIAKKITKYIEDEMSRRKIVGLSAAVVDSEGVLISKGFGMADRENKIQADSSTIFPIASITKTFTGIAVMQLVEQGLIDLDAPISTYIKDLSLPKGEENLITTRMLLTHHSGLHGDILYNWYLPEVSENPLEYEKVVTLLNETGTISPPGKLHSYCNAGYSLLGVLIHRVTGKSYVDYIHSNIFSPLGMQNSIVFAGEKTNKNITKGYDENKSLSMPMKLGTPAGGMGLSADDAAIYLQAVINSYNDNGILLKAGGMKEMMTVQNRNIPMDSGFSIGLSWFLQNPLGFETKFASHRGELPPYHSMILVMPELKIGVLISVNTNSASTAPDEIANEIISSLYKYKSGKSLVAQKQAEIISLKNEEAKQYEGIYSNVYFGPMKVIADGNSLILKSDAMPMPLTLVPREDKTFALQARFLGFFKIPVKELEAISLEFREYDGLKYLYFIINKSILNPNEKIQVYKLPPEYKNYLGKYKITNMNNSNRIVKEVEISMNKDGDFAVFKYTFLGNYKFQMAIHPIDINIAKLAGTGYFLGDKIRWEISENKTKMYWSGLILEKTE